MEETHQIDGRRRAKFWLLFVLLSLLSYNNIFRGYEVPPNFYWDENYHVSSAQKYLHGVFFMEPHPPLGKLLIALGEYLIHPNEQSDQFIDTSYATSEKLPKDFSFRGYRFFPVLFASCGPPLLFILVFLLTGELWISAAAGAFFALDNALIVHLRGAMLEGFQITFALLSLITFVLLSRAASRPARRLLALALGVVLALLLTIKVNGAVLLLLYPFLLWSWRRRFRDFAEACVLSLLAFAFVIAAVWQIHFSIATKLNPKLEKGGTYTASAKYQTVLKAQEQTSLSALPLNLREAFRYFKKYEVGVPKLNLCKDTENGSPFYFWPIGARSISYRWERNEDLVRYLYLQINPVLWFAALFGPLVASLLIGARAFYRLPPLRHQEFIVHYLLLYVGYMAAVGLIPRVMYLYHYFLPLLFSIILLALVLTEIERAGPFMLTRRRKHIATGVLALCVAAGFCFFAPLTYFRPVTNEWIASRALLSIWDLQCWNCPLTNTFARPIKDTKKTKFRFEHLRLGSLSPISGQQGWGEGQLNAAVGGGPIIIGGTKVETGFGLHAKSSLLYLLGEKFHKFTAVIGVTDDVPAGSGSVVFEVYGDNDLLFRSQVMNAGMAAQRVSVSVEGKKTLRLLILDSGDGNDSDHAAWGAPVLE